MGNRDRIPARSSASGAAKGKPSRRRPSHAGSRSHEGKSAIHLARVYGEKKRNFVGQHFWARGYFVSTVGRDEAVIREYIKRQEQEDNRLEQMNLWR
jgi:REP element-mobilizing transposase RayT